MTTAIETFDELPLPDGFAVRSAIVTGKTPARGDWCGVDVAVDTSHGAVTMTAIPRFGEVWWPGAGYGVHVIREADALARVNPDALLMAVEDEARAAVAEALVAAWGPQ